MVLRRCRHRPRRPSAAWSHDEGPRRASTAADRRTGPRGRARLRTVRWNRSKQPASPRRRRAKAQQQRQRERSPIGPNVAYQGVCRQESFVSSSCSRDRADDRIRQPGRNLLRCCGRCLPRRSSREMAPCCSLAAAATSGNCRAGGSSAARSRLLPQSVRWPSRPGSSWKRRQGSGSGHSRSCWASSS